MSDKYHSSLKNYHQCSARKATGVQCYFRGVHFINGAWYCRVHAKKVQKLEESVLPLQRVHAFRRVVAMHEQGTLPSSTNYKGLWEAMVPALLKEVMRLRGIGRRKP